MKNVLMLASVASMIDQFNMTNIELLQKLGYNVNVGCNFVNGNTCSDKQILDLKNRLDERNIKYYQVDFTRNIMDFKQNIVAYRQVLNLVQKNKYEFIHCHSPIGGVISRLVGYQEKTKVIYTAHGFHFYKGAPKKNWLIYYPIEKFLSKLTDCLITINKEDYQLAKKKFSMKHLVYCPGVGVESSKHEIDNQKIKKLREKYADENEIVFLSVGELNRNKNHLNVIQALSQLDIPYKYIICGKGNLQSRIENIVKKNNMQDRVFLAGFCTNIDEYLAMADVFCFPSYREGLSVSLMEAMVYGLPVVCSRIRGNVDLIDRKGGIFFEPDNVESIKEAIIGIVDKKELWKQMGIYNQQKMKEFDCKKVTQIMKQVYSELQEEK